MADSLDAQGGRRRYPDGATIRRWHAPDGWALRVFDWPVERPLQRGSILFQGGRGDFIEKYLESFAHWHARGWRVTAFDWRGQGGSGRTTPAPHVGHIADFADFIADLRSFWAEWSAAAQGPLVAMGHSMGGHLLLRALAERAVAPDAAVLIAPMLGLQAPMSPRLGALAAGAMMRLGDPARAAWKGNERPNTRLSRQALLTHDDARYEDELWWQAKDATLLTGPPSWAWLTQGFASTQRLNASPALREVVKPVLMLVAEADRLVDPRAALRVAQTLPDVRVIRFGAESAHEILREVDSVRNRALAEIDAFLDARAQTRA
ncbi:MAG: alpha/beta hydrolase [Sphingomonadales bacterium]|nr:alpha/beta hydrolase [Sphingomonadales bacterium]